ncbi:hypothetical protein [Actinokineospora pegani]|uniref:hypothetical protein n=1 Tax=Actinokineospora pegani TaxID=2654637 RepID=UPI0012EA3889|nr:hypothetical protein [Actinokineospora pegani]
MLADQLIRSINALDDAAFQAALDELGSSLPRLGPGEVASNAVVLAAELHRLPIGIGSYIARLLGDMCDRGADLAAVVPALVDGVLRVLGTAEQFKVLCADSGVELPDRDDEAAFVSTVESLITAVGGRLEPWECAQLVESWFAGGDWVQPVLFLAQREDVRGILPRRAELLAAVEAVAEDLPTAHWLRGLLLVLDDEPLIVLHRATSQGWRCTMSGIGDNFQLHTLLAGQFATAVGAPPPTAAELAAANTGELQPQAGITGTFNLVDAFGAWIWNEGRPADIPHCDGTRVIVLDPPPYSDPGTPAASTPSWHPA